MSPVLPSSATCAAAISRSFATTSAGTSAPSIATGLLAATCIARSLPSVSSPPVRSTSTPIFVPCTYDAIRPFASRRANRRTDRFSPIFCTSATRRAFDRLARGERAGAQRGDVYRIVTRDELRDLRGERAKIVVLGDEIGLAIDFDDRRDLRIACRRAIRSRLRPRRGSAALEAFAPLFTRSRSSALARSPEVSVSALLHSIMPSPVRWRSSITMLAEISAIACSVSLVFPLSDAGSCRRTVAALSASAANAGQKRGPRPPGPDAFSPMPP